MITILKSNENIQQKLKQILNRNHTEQNNVQQTVDEILYNIKKNGNDALFQYTKQFDGITINEQNIKVTEQEFEYAYKQVSP